MSVAPRTTSPAAPPARATYRIGCVSFLNAKPLIEGVEREDQVVKFDVPSRLLDDLERGEVDIALCPVIDLQRSKLPLEIVPVGGIGCDGPTLTVRIYSRVPLDQITEVYADTDSHTSIALMRVLLAELHNIKPAIIEYNAREHVAGGRVVTDPRTMLLIGDKVVTSAPDAAKYPHQLDLGEAWHDLTGLPFVFAVWMTRQGTELSELPASLDRARRANESRIEAIVDQHAARLGWPRDAAIQYLGHWLKYAIGPRQLEAIRLFFAKAKQHGVIDALREVRVR